MHGPPRSSLVPDHAADLLVAVHVSSPSQPVLDHGIRSHREQCYVTHFVRDVAHVEISFRVSDHNVPVVELVHHVDEVLPTMISHDIEPVADLARNQNANTRQALKPFVFQTALSLTPALLQWGSKCLRHLLQVPVEWLPMRSRIHVTRRDRLVAEGGSPLQQGSRSEAWCQNTQVRLDLSQEIHEDLDLHAASRSTSQARTSRRCCC